MTSLSGALDFAFPSVIVKGPAQSLADQLVSVQPMTESQAARGREIRDYPTRYDHFTSKAMLVEYLRYQLIVMHKDWDPAWLRETKFTVMPMNLSPGVYYRSSALIHGINCVEPQRNPQHDMLQGGTLVELDPDQWPLDVLKEVIAEVQALLKSE